MSSADKVLTLYIQQFGQIPNDPVKLVQFSKQHIGEIPTVIYSEAKDVLAKITSSIKSSKWRVGDEVLISKDRIGVLRYIGRVPELGDDQVYYGLELASGTLGQNDGAIKGKRYFQTTGRRGMFVPESKLRRRLSRKDKVRRNSYAEISAHVKQLQKEYAGSDGSALLPSAEPDSILCNVGDEADDHYDASNTTHTLVFENAEQAHKYGNGAMQYQSATMQQSQSTKRKKSLKNNASTSMQRTRSGSSGSSTSQSQSHDLSHHHNHHNHQQSQAHSRRARHVHNHEAKEADGNEESDEDNGSARQELDDDDDNESVVSDLNDAHTPGPTVKTFDTLMKYILRQKGTYREGLLDVYANPQTHSLIVEAFSQMKQLQASEQAFLWPALLKRWSKYNKN